MARTNPPDVLLAHNRWANAQLIDACEDLTVEQFHQQFDMGCGSLHDTITHILAAMRAWTDVLHEREVRMRLEGERRSLDQLRTLAEEIADAFDAATKLGPHDGVVRPERGGRTFPFSRGGILTHVTTHGVHHRAQCLNMLRQLGVEPEKLPNPAVLQWMIHADPVE